MKTSNVILIAVFIATSLTSWQSFAAQKTKSVTVTNTPLDVNVINNPSVDVINTPDVNVVNSPGVTVENDDLSPVPVTVINGNGSTVNGEQIQAKMSFEFADGIIQQQASFIIPPNKRLLVDQVAVYARVPNANQVPAFFIYTSPYTHCLASDLSCPIDVITPVGSTGLRIFPSPDKNGLNHAETQTINLFADGSLAIEHIRVGSSGSSFGWAIITGRLVDKPTN